MKKKIALLMAAVMLFGMAAGATIAYLTSTPTKVENTFTVGELEIKLDEVQVDPYGVPSTKTEEADEEGNTVVTWTPSDNAPRVQANKYKLIPGHNYTKDPTVHIQPLSEDCFVFVKVEDGLKDIEAEVTIENQMLAAGWEKLTGVDNVWYWTGDANATTVTEKPLAVSANDDIVVFNDFTLAENADVDNYKEAKIVINAYAIQKDSFENSTATEIWAKAPATWN